MIDDGGAPLGRAKRTGLQACGVPLAAAPGGLVFFGAALQLQRDPFGVGRVVHVDLSGAQMRMLGVDHAQQAAQPGLRQVGHVTGGHACGVSGHHVQPRRFPGQLRELPRDGRDVRHVISAAPLRLRVVRAPGAVTTTTPVSAFSGP